MAFLTANIDRAIVMTQYDLRGFSHPLGIRFKKGEDRKGSSFIPGNLIGFAAGFGKPEEDCKATDETYVSPFTCTYEECLTMCQQFASDCEASEKEAIQLIIQDIVAQSEEMKAKVTAGETEPSNYLKPLEKDNWWGKIVLALAEAFEVKLEVAVPA